MPTSTQIKTEKKVVQIEQEMMLIIERNLISLQVGGGGLRDQMVVLDRVLKRVILNLSSTKVIHLSQEKILFILQPGLAT